MAQKENGDATVTVPPYQMHYSGVPKIPCGKYIAEIRDPDQKRRFWLGTFDTPEKAAWFYDLDMWLLRGDMPVNNFTQTTEEYLQYANRGDANDGSGSGVKSQAEPLNLELSLAPEQYLQYANRGGANDGSGSGIKSQPDPLNLELSLAPPGSM